MANLFNENPHLKEALLPLKQILRKQKDWDLLTEISNLYLKKFGNQKPKNKGHLWILDFCFGPKKEDTHFPNGYSLYC